MNLTEKSVSKLRPGTKRINVLDDEVTGFGVRIEPSGRKSFYWFAKVHGKPRFRALGEFPSVTVGEARTAARKVAGDAAAWKQAGYQGEDPFEKKRRAEPTDVPTFAQLVEAYVQNWVRKEANRPQKAEYHVRWTVKKHFSAWSTRPIDTITIEDVLAVKNACGKHYYMANRCVEFARAIFNWTAKSKDGTVNFWPVQNPARDVSVFEEKARKRFLQPVEMVRFMEAVEDEPDKDFADFLVLALVTAARKGDVLSARWEHIDWERETWRVPHPKNGEPYDVNLLPAAMEVLRRRHRQANDSPFVFPGSGASGHVADFKKPWDAFRKRTGLADLRVHDLRRTAASFLAMAGANLPTIAAALGHNSLQSVAVYARLADESLRTAREAGQHKMLTMMAAAKKRLKISERGRRALPAVKRG